MGKTELTRAAYAARFTEEAPQPAQMLQPQCPVYVHCSRRCIHEASGAAFLQIRMVNRTDREVSSLVLSVQGLDAGQSVVWNTGPVTLANLQAPPHGAFGETRMIALPEGPALRVCVTIEKVSFTGGLSWRRLPEQRLATIEEAGWDRCTCGMRNPPEATCCAYCGKSFLDMPMPERSRSAPPGPVVLSAAARPAPVRREFAPAELPEPQQEVPRWLVALFCTLSVLALAAVSCFVLYVIGHGW